MRIRVKKVFPGEAPLEIRHQFVGLTFEAERHTIVPTENQRFCGWMGGEASPDNYDGYRIAVSELFHVIARKSKRLKEWLRAYTVLGELDAKYIMIGKDFCEVVA